MLNKPLKCNIYTRRNIGLKEEEKKEFGGFTDIFFFFA
jgi:hypothetical protein